jgi:hypothetical protein
MGGESARTVEGEADDVSIPNLDQIAQDPAAHAETRQSIIDGLRMRLHYIHPDDERPRYEATLRALQAMAALRELIAGWPRRG